MGVEYRMNLKDKYSFCSVILMTNYFVMLKDTTVEKRVNYDEFMPMVDKSDNRRIFLNGPG